MMYVVLVMMCVVLVRIRVKPYNCTICLYCILNTDCPWLGASERLRKGREVLPTVSLSGGRTGSDSHSPLSSARW